ncbi:hypothetical protein GLYMA_15G042350v4 [Glycine max]|nr:hypothetical protein GLYMA_15G042350v4 [Glycine max]KAH1145507.1 hypothetical protein GYH30_041302 [Glycine max]
MRLRSLFSSFSGCIALTLYSCMLVFDGDEAAEILTQFASFFLCFLCN